eukprot:Amastigsp_a183913_8.p4 type:complete len:109 gc:universal Amastigsp_a183913_8:867-1193(+)
MPSGGTTSGGSWPRARTITRPKSGRSTPPTGSTCSICARTPRKFTPLNGVPSPARPFSPRPRSTRSSGSGTSRRGAASRPSTAIAMRSTLSRSRPTAGTLRLDRQTAR